MTPDFEVLSGDPGGDPALYYAEQLRRIVRDAEARGLVVFIDHTDAGADVRVVRKPGRAAG